MPGQATSLQVRRLPKTIRVFVLEDNRLLGDGIAAMLRGQRDFKVVVVAKGVDPLRQARETKPDIVLLAAGFGDNHSSCHGSSAGARRHP